MARILHLTDLHLSSKEPPGSYHDLKDGGVVTEAEVESKLDLVYRGLEAYATDRRANSPLAAIVLSGDIALKGHESANEFLTEILKILEPCTEPGCPVVVVPGNHDVRQGGRGNPSYYVVSPSTPLKVVQPYMPEAGNEEDPYFLDKDAGILFVAINSSEYSGTVRSFEAVGSALDKLAAGIGEESTSEIEEVRNYIKASAAVDAPRISVQQFRHLDAAMRRARSEWEGVADGRSLFKVAVLHHHLLPVTPLEEVKPYESLTNLGQLRAFLRSHDFSLVLHGHKHQFFSYWDYIPDLERQDEPYHRLLVVSGPPLLPAGTNDPSFLELEVSAGLAPKVEITPYRLVHGPEAVRPMPKVERRLYDGFEASSLTDGFPVIVEGNTLAEAHARVLDALLGRGGEAANVICHLGDVPESFDEKELSDLFEVQEKELFRVSSDEERPIRHPADPKKRFGEIVDWWQMNNSGPSVGSRFTHGSRVRDYGHAVDQLAKVKESLSGGAITTKAVITLLDPIRDSRKPGAFPSFCLLQFVVRQSLAGRKLDCIAFFRKQEMRQWWLVNLAEIIRMRNEVLRSIRSSESGVTAGSITTLAGRAKLANAHPQVSVPAIDRDAASDEGRARLAEAVYSLASQDPQTRRKGVESWHGYFNDLKPPKDFDVDGVPVAAPGLRFLASLMGGTEEPWIRLQEAVEELANGNEQYLLASASKGVDAEKLFMSWRRDTARRISAILELVDVVDNP